MPSPKFKVGDRVRCLPNQERKLPSTGDSVSAGPVYTVAVVDTDETIRLEGMPKSWFLDSRFELVDSPKTIPLSAVLAVVEEIQAEYRPPLVGNTVNANCVRNDLTRIHTGIRKLFGHDPDAK